MAGSSGFLGTHLRRRLMEDGHEIVQLVRREPTAHDQRRWWPERGELDPSAVEGADAVINLAGAGVGDRRWNASYKDVLRSSRIDSTKTISATLAGLPSGQRPGVLLNGSAIGFYGDTGDTAVDEDSDPGTGFFPDLCRAWEAATTPAADADVRVALLRTGFPLDRDGGLLKPLLIPFRLGIGGKLGNGRQWLPWISMPDWLSAVDFVLRRSDIAGPVNLVGPDPVRNADFSKALATALHRPSIAPVPTFALRLVIGEFAIEAVTSQRVLPGVLKQRGFEFHDHDLTSALLTALHKR